MYAASLDESVVNGSSPNVRVLCTSSAFIHDVSSPHGDNVQKRTYTLSTWANFFGASKETPKNILFIPDAKVVPEKELEDILTHGWPQGWTTLTQRIGDLLTDYGVNLISYEKDDPVEALKNVDGVFVFGGNTFQLQDRLNITGMIDALQNAVLKEGLPYLGGSAGTNVATKTICTTNDMLITCPFGYEGMDILPFLVNVHYFPGTMYYKNAAGDFIEYGGESRDDRIQQFLMANQTYSYVVLLPEGTAIQREGDILTILGANTLAIATYDGDKNEYVKTPMTSEELTQYVFGLRHL